VVVTSPGSGPDKGTNLRPFQELMRWRVQHILLVSSLYDSFILAEDDQLSELLFSEFLGLDLRHIPGITRVSSGAAALDLARDSARYNLIVASPHLPDMDARELSAGVRGLGLDTPVVVLAYDQRELSALVERRGENGLDLPFLWQGDPHILLAIVKCVEDRRNAPFDVGTLGVQAVIVIEDQVQFYSSFLPLVYREVLDQARRLIPEGINLAHKLMRVQARPKILLCRTFEDAWCDFTAFGENVMGVISDVEFPRDGRLDAGAGVAFARAVRAQQPDVPVVLQSAAPENAVMAREAGAAFLLKGSPTVLAGLRRLMADAFGFGDFVFRLPDGREVGRAADLGALEEQLRTVPAASIGYHGERNHFSNWLKARTEFALAHTLRPRRVSEFATLEHLRHDIVESIRRYRGQQRRGATADFDPAAFDVETSFARIGTGSLGGKARGLAFVNYLLSENDVRDAFPGVRIGVPAAVVLATDWFDAFLAPNGLRDFAITAEDDRAIVGRFLEAPLPSGRRACSRTPNTSRSRASTTRSCSPTITRSSRSGAGRWRLRSSASTPRRSCSGPRPTSRRRRIASRRRRWR
jgi:CheY-like chemotaxis protein